MKNDYWVGERFKEREIAYTISEEMASHRVDAENVMALIKAHHLWLNSALAKKTPECVEYILVHEMVHLLERHHNDQFKHLMDRFMPRANQ